MSTTNYRVPTFAGALPPLEERTVLHVLRANAAHRSDTPALRDPDSELTHSQLLQSAMVVAGGLRDNDVMPDDRVLLMLDNHLDAALIWLGCTLAGAVEVPVNTAYRSTFLEHVVQDSGATTAVVEARYADALRAAAGDTPLRIIVRDDAPMSLHDRFAGAAPLAVERAPWQLAGVFYTSGTTGASKGVPVPHAQAYGYATPVHMGVAGADDCSYVALPLFHVGGQLWGVYNALIAGGAAFIAPRFSASRFWAEVAESHSTFAMLTGAMVSFLNAQPRAAGEDSSGLRVVCLAPVPQDVDDFCRRFGVTYTTGYGSTEAAAPLVAPHGVSRAGSVGWARPDFDVRVVDEHDRPLPDRQVGELVIRPSEPWTMFPGYLGRAEATANAWRNLWFHTGDAVYRTSEGEYILVDRLRDSIRRRGENISSMEVEAAANAHVSVAESAAVAVPSAHSEDEVLLYVMPAPVSAVDPEQVYRYLAGQLPYFAVPRFIAVVADFQRTGSNKIQKHVLRERGLPADCWDAEKHGLRATRDGLVEPTEGERKPR